MTTSNTLSTDKKPAIRNSGIELLKILAILLIVLYHVCKTLSLTSDYVSFNGYVVAFDQPTANIRYFILTLFSYGGSLGNNIFFISSAWFLLESKKLNMKKWMFMLFEVWIISIAIFAIMTFVLNGEIDPYLILRSFFPTTFTNNWYITCYLLFYPIHPILNSIIYKADQKQLLRMTSALCFIYILLNFFFHNVFLWNYLFFWTALYFVMAYLKLYLKDAIEDKKRNVLMLIFGFLGYILVAVIANYVGIMDPDRSYVLYWNASVNPFLILIALSSFNLMRKTTFKSRIINYISSLSLLIYIIHENIIIREYLRPAMWDYVYKNIGYDLIILDSLALMVIIFIASVIISALYDVSIRRIVRKISEVLYELISKICLKIETGLLRLK